MEKNELLRALITTREDFRQAVDGLPDEALLEPGVCGNWSIKDMMAHIMLWESELVKLLWEAKEGRKPTTIHFQNQDSKAIDETNARWYRENKDRPLDIVLEDFEGVRRQTIRRLEGFQNRDLTDPKRFSWLKETPLWKWVAGDSFKHEAEHIAEIRAWREKKGI
jgi:hypothetical protein